MVETLKNSLFLGMLFCGLYANAQAVVYKQENVTKLTDKHIVVNRNNVGKLIGFYVQICSESGSNSRERSETVRRLFLSKYPKIGAHVSFKEPNFRVRVGDFRTRAEARGFKEQIQLDFPQSFVVKDEVRYPKHIFETTE